jgi:hypothetical protein
VDHLSTAGKVSAAEMQVQRRRLEVLTSNLVNSRTAQAAGAEPYKHKDVVFAATSPESGNFKTSMDAAMNVVHASAITGRKKPMYNVACLCPKYFKQMADGSNTKEFRWRQRPDPRLEKVVPGEPILFLESRTDRALLSRVVSIRRIVINRYKSTSFLIYVIRISRNLRVIRVPMRRVSGWFRREKKDLVPLLKRAAAYEFELGSGPSEIVLPGSDSRG